MTDRSLRSALSGLAAEVPPVDLLDGVRDRARGMRWRRRGAVAAAFVTVAGVAVGGTLLPQDSGGHTPHTATQPSPTSPLPAEIDLTSAADGSLTSASLVLLSGGEVYAYDVTTDRVVHIAAAGRHGPPMLSADGTRLAFAPFEEVATPARPGQPDRIDDIAVLDLSDGGSLVFTRPLAAGRASSAHAISPDGSKVATVEYTSDAAGNWSGPPSIEITEVASGAATSLPFSPLPQWDGSADPLTELFWSPDGASLALGGGAVIDAQTGATRSAGAGSPPLVTSPWSPDGTDLLRSADESVGVWSALPPNGRALATAPRVGVPVGFAGVGQILWMNDHQLFVTTLDGTSVGRPTEVISAAPVDAVSSALGTAGQ